MFSKTFFPKTINKKKRSKFADFFKGKKHSIVVAWKNKGYQTCLSTNVERKMKKKNSNFLKTLFFFNLFHIRNLDAWVGELVGKISLLFNVFLQIPKCTKYYAQFRISKRRFMYKGFLTCSRNCKFFLYESSLFEHYSFKTILVKKTVFSNTLILCIEGLRKTFGRAQIFFFFWNYLKQTKSQSKKMKNKARWSWSGIFFLFCHYHFFLCV